MINFLFLTLLSSTGLGAVPFCNHYAPPKEFTSLKARVEEKIKAFANKKTVAGKADETLSKLLTAKSPVIASWLSQRHLTSETEIIREWRAYYVRHLVLNKYPQHDAAVDREIETLMGDINRQFATKSFQKKMETVFLKSKKAALATVKKFPLTDDQKKKITFRLEAVQLYWMKDFKNSKFKNFPMDFLDWGIAYDPVANEINMGLNALAYPNEETYLAVFAHELGHAFDSCRWGAFFAGDWPFQKIAECLRSDKSANAKKRDDSKLELLAKEDKEMAAALQQNPTCNRIVYPPAGMQADQLPETFADWFATEVMASMENIKPVAMRIDLCEQKELSAGSSYPTNEMRLNGIYLAHPKFRKLGADQYQHCSW